MTQPASETTLPTVTRRLLPFLFVLYIVAFIDRVNIGFAALQMNRDLGLSAGQYGLAAGVFFIGYALFEVPSNLILARMGARRWIARIMISWGVLASAMMFVRGPVSLNVLRFLLGVAEAGFFPGIIFYLSSWYPAEERARAVARFMSALPVSLVVGAPLAAACLRLDGRAGLAGWQWLFLLEGLPAVALGVLVLRYLPDGPAQARWLSDAQRAWLAQRLADDRAVPATAHAGRRPGAHGDGLRALLRAEVWWLSIADVGIATGLYGLTLWLPLMLQQGTGLSDSGVAWVLAVPYGIATVTMLLAATRSDRSGERLLWVAVPTAVAGAAFLASSQVGPVGGMVALTVAAAAILSVFPPFWALATGVLRGSTASAAGIALINAMGNLGGFVAPYVVGALRQSSGGFAAGLVFLAVVAFLSSLLLVAFRRRFTPVRAEAR